MSISLVTSFLCRSMICSCSLIKLKNASIFLSSLFNSLSFDSHSLICFTSRIFSRSYDLSRSKNLSSVILSLTYFSKSFFVNLSTSLSLSVLSVMFYVNSFFCWSIALVVLILSINLDRPVLVDRIISLILPVISPSKSSYAI